MFDSIPPPPKIAYSPEEKAAFEIYINGLRAQLTACLCLRYPDAGNSDVESAVDACVQKIQAGLGYEKGKRDPNFKDFGYCYTKARWLLLDILRKCNRQTTLDTIRGEKSVEDEMEIYTDMSTLSKEEISEQTRRSCLLLISFLGTNTPDGFNNLNIGIQKGEVLEEIEAKNLVRLGIIGYPSYIKSSQQTTPSNADYLEWETNLDKIFNLIERCGVFLCYCSKGPVICGPYIKGTFPNGSFFSFSRIKGMSEREKRDLWEYLCLPLRTLARDTNSEEELFAELDSAHKAETHKIFPSPNELLVRVLWETTQESEKICNGIAAKSNPPKKASNSPKKTKHP